MVVVERQGEVAGVGQEEVAVFGEGVGEEAGVFVRPVEVGALDWWRGGAGCLVAQVVPASADLALLVGGERGFPCGAGPVGVAFGVDDQVDECFRPECLVARRLFGPDD